MVATEQDQTNEKYNPIPTDKKESDGEILSRHDKELAWQGKILNWTFVFMGAILVVCVVAFITFLLDAWRFHAESYKQFTDTSILLEKESRDLREAQLNLKIDALQKEIDQVKETQLNIDASITGTLKSR